MSVSSIKAEFIDWSQYRCQPYTPSAGNYWVDDSVNTSLPAWSAWSMGAASAQFELCKSDLQFALYIADTRRSFFVGVGMHANSFQLN
jgi:hypothetical protein